MYIRTDTTVSTTICNHYPKVSKFYSLMNMTSKQHSQAFLNFVYTSNENKNNKCTATEV